MEGKEEERGGGEERDEAQDKVEGRKRERSEGQGAALKGRREEGEGRKQVATGDSSSKPYQALDAAAPPLLFIDPVIS